MTEEKNFAEEFAGYLAPEREFEKEALLEDLRRISLGFGALERLLEKLARKL